MKRLKVIFSVILLLILIVFLPINNSYALSADDLIFAANTSFDMAKSYVGQSIPIDFAVLKASPYLYCVQVNGKMRTGVYNNYQIVNYISIEGNKSIDATGKEVENEANGIMAAIIGNTIYPKGYGTAYQNYTGTQYALYNYWYNWMTAVGEPEYNISGFSYDNSSYGASCFSNIQQMIASQNYTYKAKIFFLKCWGAEGFQTLICAVGEGTVKVESTGTTIDKIDGSTGKYLSRVSFIVKNNITGEYIKKEDITTVQDGTTGKYKYVYKNGEEVPGPGEIVGGIEEEEIRDIGGFSNAYIEGDYIHNNNHGVDKCYDQWMANYTGFTSEGLTGLKEFIKACHGQEYLDEHKQELSEFWYGDPNRALDMAFEEWVKTIERSSEVTEYRFEDYALNNYDVTKEEFDDWLEFAKLTGKFDIDKIIEEGPGVDDGEYSEEDFWADSNEYWYNDDWYQDGPFTAPTKNAILKWANEEFESELDEAYEESDDPRRYLVNELGITEDVFIDTMFSVISDKMWEEFEQDSSSFQSELEERIGECYYAFLTGQSFGTTSSDDYGYTHEEDFEAAIDAGAMVFTTGVSTYSSIVIEGLPSGAYTVVEVENLNDEIVDEDTIGTSAVMQVTAGIETKLPIINNPPPPTIKDDDHEEDDDKPGTGNVTISGTVWDDGFAGKGNNNNSTKDSTENGVAGVKVYWKTRSGEVIASDTTDQNGYYEMAHKLTVTTTKHGKSIYNNNLESTSTYKMLNDSYIEFEYNGLKYTTVAYSDGADKSKGVELPDTRTALDNSFDEINNQGVLDNYTQRYNLSYSYSGDNTSSQRIATLNQDILDFAVKANTDWMHNLLDNYADTSDGYYAHNVRKRYCDNEDCNGHWRKTDYYYDTDEWEIKNMNLGLVQREQPDIAITSDIDEVRVIMKDQIYTYEYGNRNISSDTNVSEYTVQFEKKTSPGVYTRPVNPSDIAYMNSNNSDKNVRIYVKYVMRVKNQSNTLPVKIQELVNYYDDDYTITSTADWKDSSKYSNKSFSGNGYKSAYSTKLSNKTLQPGGISDPIEIEFEVNQKTVAGLINEKDVLIRNIVEINGYTTYYGADTQCSENRTASEAGKTNSQYAGIDIDSQPGNVSLTGNEANDRKTFEDDTDEAPVFKLNVNRDYKIISGTVFEDTNTMTNGERKGNGLYESNQEKPVENVRVELWNVDKNTNLPTEIAKKYYIRNGKTETEDAITYTNSNGEYSFDGMVTDRYIIKYIYGNDTEETYGNGQKLERETKINGNVINARNYKSTVITTNSGPVYGASKGDGNQKWHLTMADNVSTALDDLDVRLSIPELKYSNFDEPHNMVAYTPIIEFQVEYNETGEQSSQVTNNGNKQSGNYSGAYDGDNSNGTAFEIKPDYFDFGIIERPREDIVIDKTIENLKITLANGQVLTEGNPYTESMNYVRALGKTEIFDRNAFQDSMGKEKALYIEMDTELIQGARLDILYAITVTNNSEIDYEYDQANGGNGDYYYYGEINSPLIKPSAELVVDYVDAELTCTTETDYNVNWTQKQAQDLYDQGFISAKTLEQIKKENYLIFTTEVFKDLAHGESHKEYLFASKLLANQAEDYVYENHAEIIQLNGKIARNIDSVANNSREQVRKTYKPGDYVPSLERNHYNTEGEFVEAVGYHQQDDDMITIRITPPTGLTNNITLYIIVGAVALIVLAGGIIIIRKKVLGK